MVKHGSMAKVALARMSKCVEGIAAERCNLSGSVLCNQHLAEACFALAHTSVSKSRQGLGLRRFLRRADYRFQLMFAFVILSHDRRRPLHFAVTANPTAEWIARQLLEAFPWDNASQYLLRDRDSIYGEKFCETARWMGIREVLTAPQSPWQNGHVERFIGSIRRECLHHLYTRKAA
jgi:transposase InsO family protein